MARNRKNRQESATATATSAPVLDEAAKVAAEKRRGRCATSKSPPRVVSTLPHGWALDRQGWQARGF